MTNFIELAADQVRLLIDQAVTSAAGKGLLAEGADLSYDVEIPADTTHGDFAANAAMKGARAFKLAPQKIAQILCNEMDFGGTYFEKCEIAGPGFMNFFLSPGWFADVLSGVAKEGADYGSTNYGEGKKILVEFVSANPTGPMHIGNARGGALGDCLASVLQRAGYYVEREFYVNDAGNQIEKFATSLEVRYLQLYREGVELPEDAYKGVDIIEHAKNFAGQYGERFVDVPSKERREALVDFALPVNVATLKKDLGSYRIEYDTWFFESTLHQNGAVDQTIELLKEKGYTYEQEGALWFKGSDFGADKDFVIVRANGIPTYVVPDIAYHYNKLVTRGFDKAINVLGADHHGYIARLKAALQALGIDPARLDVVMMQMVNLVRDGEIIKASKRSGKAITLSTLLEEIPIDAARFFFNMREPNSHFDFDLDLAVEQSSQNPVYYVQYAYARICSILKKLQSEGVCYTPCGQQDLRLLCTAEEIALIRHLAMLPEEIVGAARQYDSSRITRYVLELAARFHKFYTVCRVRCEDEKLSAARLQLCVCTQTVLKNALDMLKIMTPESM